MAETNKLTDNHKRCGLQRKKLSVILTGEGIEESTLLLLLLSSLLINFSRSGSGNLTLTDNLEGYCNRVGLRHSSYSL